MRVLTAIQQSTRVISLYLPTKTIQSYLQNKTASSRQYSKAWAKPFSKSIPSPSKEALAIWKFKKSCETKSSISSSKTIRISTKTWWKCWMKNMNSTKACLIINQASMPWVLIIPRNSRLEACSQIRIRNRACKTTWLRYRSNRPWKSKWASIHSRQNRIHWVSRMSTRLPFEELELVEV